eukprot:gnl/MRDRNA2_/MRDRNA2_178221_c0_seq1.p1 gnl/MRDRNA2_/MRDRNA2_178221_c0~~gnl/MRDRNA2_/MRDRNA2_178221_c0_seq1.p1  ORF type:complete len:319 (-),score=62.75 gnl/MRDRNA2_/MRDRNA2_178221_c0_seq1:1-936(-)
MAIALFGREMDEFSTFYRAFNTCFLVLMGEFEFYEEMFAEARQMGAVWFWLFQAVLVLVMLNMLLAIIMDTYTEVKGASSYTETLPQQLFSLMKQRQLIRTGRGLHLKTVDIKLEEIYGPITDRALSELSLETKWEPDEMISMQGFADMIDGIEFDQAEMLVIQAVRAWRLEHLDPVSLTEAMTLISVIHHLVRDQGKTIADNHRQLVNQSADVHQITHELASTSVSESHPGVTCNGSAGASNAENGTRIETLEVGLTTANNKLSKLELDLQKTNEHMTKMNDNLERMQEMLLRIEERQMRPLTFGHLKDL